VLFICFLCLSCLKKQGLDALLPHLNYYLYVLACVRNYETILSSDEEYIEVLEQPITMQIPITRKEMNIERFLDYCMRKLFF